MKVVDHFLGDKITKDRRNTFVVEHSQIVSALASSEVECHGILCCLYHCMRNQLCDTVVFTKTETVQCQSLTSSVFDHESSSSVKGDVYGKLDDDELWMSSATFSPLLARGNCGIFMHSTTLS